MRSDEAAIYRHLKLVISLKQVMEMVIAGESSENLRKYAGCSQFARKYMQLLDLISSDIKLPDIFDRYTQIPKPTNMTGTIRKELFESVLANLSILQGFLETAINEVGDEVFTLRDFLQARLRSAIPGVPENEKDVQNVIEGMLIGKGMQKGQDYDREAGRVKFSGKESVPDFNLIRSSLALEVKFVKDRQRVGQIVDEINADIAAYSTGYRHLLFLVYDLGHIQNEIEFRQDLESAPNVFVVVVKH